MIPSKTILTSIQYHQQQIFQFRERIEKHRQVLGQLEKDYEQTKKREKGVSQNQA